MLHANKHVSRLADLFKEGTTVQDKISASLDSVSHTIRQPLEQCLTQIKMSRRNLNIIKKELRLKLNEARACLTMLPINYKMKDERRKRIIPLGSQPQDGYCSFEDVIERLHAAERAVNEALITLDKNEIDVERFLETSKVMTKPSRQAIPKKVQREVWRRDQGKCVRCGSRENLEFDHIIPLARGGGNTARNIHLLCESCNRAKSAKEPGTW